MIYTELTIKAMKIAYNAHHGQVDKANTPIFFHPFHLAEQMEDEISTVVALLHDVVEDTTITFEDLEKEFPQEVIVPLRYLTHDKEVDYLDYVTKINENPIAKKVKLADIAHNADHTRFVGMNMPQYRLDYWNKKYKKAKEILTEKNS